MAYNRSKNSELEEWLRQAAEVRDHRNKEISVCVCVCVCVWGGGGGCYILYLHYWPIFIMCTQIYFIKLIISDSKDFYIVTKKSIFIL